ncbi:hypothetical protein TSUD_99110 [Trifolium subterraneum]|uniref:Reverse transcriptase domain-containing protein n=1 Tax=Trifolium subterraneum TaxID=3900 RepID=A0A2Z6P2N7_TRISU|nr:hypothetical protein TSUD_99110 [Trifolium subterraneum]
MERRRGPPGGKGLWADIKGDFMRFLLEFYSNGQLVKGSNCTFIALIPKVVNPQRIADYRPISLVGCMYKVLAKVLANRLKSVIGYLRDPISFCQRPSNFGWLIQAYLKGIRWALKALLLFIFLIYNLLMIRLKVNFHKGLLIGVNIAKAWVREATAQLFKKIIPLHRREESRKINWIEWDKICLDKEYGGLGLRRVKEFNISLLGKWCWRLLQEPESLWFKVLAAKYGTRDGQVDIGGFRASNWWKVINSIRFGIDLGSGTWFGDNVVDSTDVWEWIPDHDTGYSVGGAYNLLTRMYAHETSPHNALICNKLVPSKSAIISWLGIACVLPDNALSLASQFCGAHGFNKNIKTCLQAIWIASIWSIWKARNNRVFNGKTVNLNRFGFGVTWRSWIRACVFSGNLYVLVNGSPAKEINIQRGLKQGDPLAPFLFLLVVEGLSGAVRSPLSLTFGRQKQFSETLNLPQVLSNFLGVAKRFLHCRVGSLPFMYLGLPEGANPRKERTWKPLLDTLTKRLSDWTFRYVSLGGRVVLLNSIINPISIFYLSFMKMPIKIWNLIVKMQRQFLWGTTIKEQKIPWVSWTNVCKPKADGGLGVRDLRVVNLALLGKWRWRLLHGGQGIWRDILLARYRSLYPSPHLGGRLVGFRGTWWRDIFLLGGSPDSSSNWFSEEIGKKIDNGLLTLFWFEQ